MQNKHYFFFLFGNPNVRGGGGGGASRLGQIPNFYRKFVLKAPLMVLEIVVSFFMVTMTRKQFDCLSSVTLSTHATVNFLKHLPTLVFGIYT